MQCAATAGALLVLDIDDDLVARQVCWQGTTIAVGHLDAPPSLPHLWQRRFRRHSAPHPPAPAAVGRGRASPNEDHGDGAADAGSAATASRSRLAAQAPLPAASAAEDPDRQAAPRDRSAQLNDADARRRVAANDSRVIAPMLISLPAQVPDCAPSPATRSLRAALTTALSTARPSPCSSSAR